MTLGGRIAQARKQAGLSQEQLGEKLGVSRQAVSKWESDQTNPDVAYVAQMCRLLEVPAGWLLLGEEGNTGGLFRRCPRCQGTITGVEKFCPSCGWDLAESPEELRDDSRYNLFLWEVQDKISAQYALRRFYQELPEDSGCTLPDCILDDPMRYDITLAESAPVAICQNADRSAAQLARRLLAGYAELRTYPAEAGDSWVELSSLPPVDSLSTQRPSKEPMTFGMTVLAVIAGIVGAVILLAFL